MEGCAGDGLVAGSMAEVNGNANFPSAVFAARDNFLWAAATICFCLRMKLRMRAESGCPWVFKFVPKLGWWPIAVVLGNLILSKNWVFKFVHLRANVAQTLISGQISAVRALSVVSAYQISIPKAGQT